MSRSLAKQAEPDDDTGRRVSLDDSAKWANAIARSAYQPIIVLDHKLRVLAASLPFYQTFKVTAEHIRGKPAYELIKLVGGRISLELNGHHVDLPILVHLLEKVISGETPPLSFEVDYIFPQTGRRVVLMNARPSRGSDRAKMLLLTLEDITRERRAEEALEEAKRDLEKRVAERTMELKRSNQELSGEIAQRKQAMEALKKAEENFHNSLDNSPLGIRILTADGENLYANRAILDICGYETLDELNATPITTRYTPQCYAEYLERQAKRQRGEPFPDKYEISFVRKDGELRYLAVSCKEVLWDGKVQIQAIYQDITERKLAEARLLALSRRLVEIQEEERRNIAHELHDQIIQSLAMAKMMLEKTYLKKREDEVSPEMVEINEILMEVIDQVREMSLDLSPRILDDLGLLPALKWYFKRYSTRTAVQVRFRHAGLGKILPAEINTTAYRIVQEALSNVARHARVSEVAVSICVQKEWLVLDIKDGGIGFDRGTVATTCSGLNGMEERAYLVGGKMTVSSAPGAGTRVTAELPLKRPNTAGVSGGQMFGY